MSNLLERMRQLATLAPASLKHDVSTITIKPNAVTEYLFRPSAELVAQLELTSGEPELAGLRTGKLVLTEVRHVRQIKAGTTDEWMDIIELTIAAPEARVLMRSGTDWIEAPFYEACPAFASQTPQIFGQHMGADPAEIDRLRVLLREHNWTAIEIGQGTQGTGTGSRVTSWSLGAPIAKESRNYGDTVRARSETGLPVNEVSVSPRDPNGEYKGFVDFVSSLAATFATVVADSMSPDAQIKERANRLVSSLTGLSVYTNAEGVVSRAPQRAPMAVINVNGTLFNFWTQKPVEGDTQVITTADVNALVGSPE